MTTILYVPSGVKLVSNNEFIIEFPREWVPDRLKIVDSPVFLSECDEVITVFSFAMSQEPLDHLSDRRTVERLCAEAMEMNLKYLYYFRLSCYLCEDTVVATHKKVVSVRGAIIPGSDFRRVDWSKPKGE